MPDDRLVRTSRELFLAAVTGGSADIPAWIIDRITALLEEEEVEIGRRVFAAGDPIEFVYFMREGRLQLVGDGVPTWTYEGRWVIGPADALLERPYRRTGIALTDLNLLKIRVDDWLDLLEDSAELVRSAVANAARGVAALEVRLWASQPEPRGVAVTTVRGGEPLSFVDRLATLSDVEFLRAGGVQVLADLVALAEERTLGEGDFLWRRGNPPGEAFLVIAGEVVAERTDPLLEVRFGPGSIVGGLASLGPDSAQAWEARASSATRVLAIGLEDWFDLMEEHFDLARSALGGISLRREEILNQLADGSNEIVLT
jgi:CRP-like cAMP-binding protein